jgi:glycosyltransferase involved in cell wall biosynthesis
LEAGATDSTRRDARRPESRRIAARGERRMKIAITADPMLPVPPRLYGGIERIIDMLVRGLVQRGHEVTLFAHRDSDVPCDVVPYAGRTAGRATDIVRNTLSVSRLLADRPDVVHSFGRLAYLTPLLATRIPKIMSYQRAPSPRSVGRAIALARRGSLAFTGCSAYIASKINPGAPVFAIHNGVDLGRYPPRYDVASDAPLMFLGRIEAIKGAHHAIRVARSAGRRLVIAGTIADNDAGRQYFEEAIAPHIDGAEIQYVGPVNDARKATLLGESAALLMPIEWEEPFGIVMAEALACGTPVLGFPRGAVAEVIRHGVNGFVCDSVEEMAAAVSALGTIDRRVCRADCAARFSDTVIVDAYERLYHQRVAQ